MPKLPVGLATEFRQVGTTNGFELFRLLAQKLDPPRADCAFHLANELRSCAPAQPCKDFAQTVQFVKYFDQKQLDFTTETGEMFPDSDAARVFSQAIDEDTMGRVDDHEDLSIETYAPVKAWILQREIKLRLRKNTRTSKGKGPDDMVYGVSAAPPAEAPAGAPAADQGPDPWLSAASDPWSSPPGLPEAPAALLGWACCMFSMFAPSFLPHFPKTFSHHFSGSWIWRVCKKYET